MTMHTTSTNGHGAADRALMTAVSNALDQYTPLRVWKHAIQIDARDGAVTLSGIVRSRSVKETAEQLVRKVKGVTTIKNELIADSDVEIAVTQALVSDPRTRAGFPGILVGVVFGVVYLKGTVASAEIKNAAGEIVRKIAGVQRVSNGLIAPEPQKAAAKA